MSRRTFAAVVTGVAVALLMSGCIGGSNSSTSTAVAPSAPSAPASPTAEPVDPLSTVTTIVARPDVLELRDAGGAVVEALDYMGSVDDALATLTTVFEAPPVDEPYAGTNHAPGGVFHRWDLFVLDERLYDEARRQAEGYDWVVWPRFAVYFDGPAADGIVLATASGRQAGDAWAEVASDPGFDAGLWTCTGTSIEAVTTTVPSGWTGRDRVNVIVMPTGDGATVKWIGAPELEADGCA